MAETTTLKLPDSLKKRIAPLADAAGKTPHAWMVEALEAQADLAEKRRAFHGEARARLAEFERTGTAYRAADVHRYFGALVSGRKAKRPRSIKA
jgi:predicted transcriptional regulator